jgi:phage protein U
MQIGTIGDIVFEVSSERVHTFDGLIQRTGGRWEDHQPIGAPVRPEFLGPDQGVMEFNIKLHASLGVNPKTEKEKIEAMVISGHHAPFMLGNAPIGEGNWYIATCETTHEIIDNAGRLLKASLHITLREHPIRRRGRT